MSNREQVWAAAYGAAFANLRAKHSKDLSAKRAAKVADEAVSTAAQLGYVDQPRSIGVR